MRRNSLGEAAAIELIARIARRRNRDIVKAIGDDAALYRDGLVVTTDAYLDDVHFDRSYLDLTAVGARAMCGTLSDLAAMSASPIGVFVALMIPAGTGRAALRALYQGMDAICGMFDTEIAGGDIVASAKLGLALTALGRTLTPRLRSDARPGDWLYVTGSCALAETGRLALRYGLRPGKYRAAIARHVCPIPRIREALRLAPQIHGLIDTSDGLSTDAGHIADESRVKLVIDYDRLPIAPETDQLMADTKIGTPPVFGAKTGGVPIFTRERFVVSSGEDYELLFTSPNRNLPTSVLGTPLTRIGRVEPGHGVFLDRNGRQKRLRASGYDHLRWQREGRSC
jgi:thiamine-monophosphate kinase